MENASKALIIAGSILVAILIISLGVMVFNRFSGTAKEMANMNEQEISAFNSKIQPYLGNSITGSQVNSLLQYCLSVNMSAKQSGDTRKVITVSGAASINADSTSFTRVETGGKPYIVQGTYDANTGLLTQINITRKS